MDTPKETTQTTYKAVTIYVKDNGYSLNFLDYRGSSPLGNGAKVAKNLGEVRDLLAKNLYPVIDE